jgi:hypothetical protein
MADEKISAEQTWQSSEHEFIVRPPLNNADLEHLDRLIQRAAARRPTSEFSEVTEHNRYLIRHAAELYGLDRLEWALVELCFRPGAILTIDSLEEELYEIHSKQRSARRPRELEKEDILTAWVLDLFGAGVLKNLDDFFRFRESWDSPALRRRIREELAI